MNSGFFPTLLLLLLLAACGRSDQVRTAISDSAQAPHIDPGTVAGAAALDLWQLRSGVTLGEWKTAHPDEAITDLDSTPVSRFAGSWCAVARRRTTLGERAVARSAYFYPPATVARTLPESQAQLVAACELGFVWITVDVPDSSAGVALADSVRTQLGEAFGAPVAGPVSFFGSAYWSDVARFRTGGVTAVAALGNPAPGAGATRPRQVIAFAYLRGAGIGTGDDSPENFGPWQPPDSLPVDSAVRLTGLDSARYAPLAALLSAAASGRHAGISSQQFPDSLAQPLRRWLDASAARTLPQRAAALYVADLVLDRALCVYVRCDARQFAALQPLRALGAQFEWEPLGASWVYQRGWLGQARILDRDSPLGQRILLAPLNAGFDFSGRCAEGPEAFQRVIDNATRYLERVPDSPIAAEVSFLLGEAYRDIVALAHGAGDIYADSSRYTERAAAAAQSAVGAYQRALQVAPLESELAKQAWKQAWALKAGLVPRETRFYCVYD